MVLGIVNIMLFSFINEMFNFCIDNVIGKKHYYLVLVLFFFKFTVEEISRGRQSYSSENKCFYDGYFITMESVVAGIYVFYLSKW